MGFYHQSGWIVSVTICKMIQYVQNLKVDKLILTGWLAGRLTDRQIGDTVKDSGRVVALRCRATGTRLQMARQLKMQANAEWP